MRIWKTSCAVLTGILVTSTIACKDKEASLSDRRSFCLELTTAYKKFQSQAEYALQTVEAQNAKEQQNLQKAAKPSSGVSSVAEEQAQRDRVCAKAAIQVHGSLQHLLGMDRSSHIFFQLGKDKRHEQAGLVHSELSNHNTLFEAERWYKSCSERAPEKGDLASLKKTRTDLSGLMKPYLALCKQL